MPRLLCMLDANGLPLLVRPYGGYPPPLFPTVALLSSVAKYAEHNGFLLHRLASDDARIFYSTFPEGILLVLIVHDAMTPDSSVRGLLQLVYEAATLQLGESVMHGNTEHLKRQLRGATALIDRIMNDEIMSLGILLGCVELLHIPQEQFAYLQKNLDELAASAMVQHAAISVCGRVCCATSQWWSLAVSEMVLFQQLMVGLPSPVDMVVYLPSSSPRVPCRLMALSICDGVELIVLCGPSLAASNLGLLANEHFPLVLTTLRDYVSYSPGGCCPEGVDFRACISWCLVVNRCASQSWWFDQQLQAKQDAKDSPLLLVPRGFVTFVNMVGSRHASEENRGGEPTGGAPRLTDHCPLPSAASAFSLVLEEERMMAIFHEGMELHVSLTEQVSRYAYAAPRLLGKVLQTLTTL